LYIRLVIGFGEGVCGFLRGFSGNLRGIVDFCEFFVDFSAFCDVLAVFWLFFEYFAGFRSVWGWYNTVFAGF